MTAISEVYNDQQLLDALLAIRPGVSIDTEKVRIDGVEADSGPYNKRPVVRVLLEFSVTPEEFRQVLDASRA